MSIRVVQLGSPRQRDEGVRMGTVRRPPRGVPKADFGTRDYYDIWLPELSPSASLLRHYRSRPDTPKNWKAFMRRFERELAKPPAARILELLVLLSSSTNFSVGCYCDDEAHCHRSTLRARLIKQGAVMAES